MTLWVCLSCTTKYAVGLDECPHCGTAEYYEDGENMAKITRAGGSSMAGDPPDPNLNNDPATAKLYEDQQREPSEKEEPSSVGINSERSSENLETLNTGEQPQTGLEPVQETANLSVPESEESSTADSADTDTGDEQTTTRRRRR